MLKFNKKIYNYSIGSLRAFPLTMPLGCFLFGLIFQNKLALYFAINFYIADLISHGLKITFKQLYKLLNTDILPILGSYKRPKDAKYCGCFISEDNLKGISTSTGLPSGHSLLAGFTTIFFILFLLDKYSITSFKQLLVVPNYKIIISLFTVIMIGVSICYSRIYLKCHTINQVIVGSLIGGLLGYGSYKLYNKYIK